MILSSCSNSNQDSSICQKFQNETYLQNETNDASSEIMETYRYYLSKFGDSSIKGLESEAYQMMYYSSHKIGKFLKFEKTSNGVKISAKCINETDLDFYCEEGETILDIKSWDTFIKMIYEFNYWTENRIEVNSGYLDSSFFILEGNRPEAKLCGKLDYNLVVRANPEYDKIESLCNEIMRFEEMNKQEKTNYVF